jgi:hypothetical protein
MSLLPTGTYANPTQPLWTPFGGGGGGGLDASFNNVSINLGGTLNMSNEAPFSSNAYLNFYRSGDGSDSVSVAMLWRPGTAVFSNAADLALSLVGPANTYDDLVAGNVVAVGPNLYGTSNALTLGGPTPGLRWGPVASPLFTLFDVVGSNWAISNLATINGKQLAQAGESTTSGPSNIVTIPTPYADTSYAVIVTPYTQETMWATPTTSNTFTVTTAGSNVQYSWMTMPFS